MDTKPSLWQQEVVETYKSVDGTLPNYVKVKYSLHFLSSKQWPLWNYVDAMQSQFYIVFKSLLLQNVYETGLLRRYVPVKNKQREIVGSLVSDNVGYL